MFDAAELAIAGATVRLALAPGQRLAHNLAPFATAGAGAELDVTAVDLHLALASRPWFDVPPRELLAPREVLASRTPRGGALRFVQRAGCLELDSGLAHARAWDRLAEQNSSSAGAQPEFSGHPWLLLALWGHLSQAGAALLHGALCTLEGTRVLLLGESGAGKSTLSGLLLAQGEACHTDEFPVIRALGDEVWAHATPWTAVARPRPTPPGPVGAVFILRHGERDRLRLLPRSAAARAMMPHTRFFTWAPATVPATITLLDRLVSSVPVFDLAFRPTAAVVALMRGAL